MALEAARALRAQQPQARATRYGDMEGAEWWERHAATFEEARLEWGAACDAVYHLDPPPEAQNSAVSSSSPCRRWLRPEVESALLDGGAQALRSNLLKVCEDSAGHAVFQLDLFTEDFCDKLLSELDHLESSGIPLRRPNGMNRYGAILSQLGFQEGLLEPLMREVVLPLGRLLWPEWVAASDCDETYGFVVRYRIGEDVDLAEHADTSNVTLNVCLGREFEGGDLYFKGVRFTDSKDDQQAHLVKHKKGSAVIHLGGHFHGVHPIVSGERSNLVLWGTGPQGVVRIRPETPPRAKIIQCAGF